MTVCQLDHIVVAAETLEAGVVWLKDKLGMVVPEGGEHPLMGTHNRLMQIGNGAFLEIIAIDPQATPPARPRWYGLDDPAIQARLARAPALLTWVVRTDDIRKTATCSPVPLGAIEQGRRGKLKWKITIPEDGSMPEGGLFPTVIQWRDFAGPASAMPDLGCRLDRLTIRHPEPQRLRKALAAIGADGLVEIERAAETRGPGLAAAITGPRGRIEL